MTTIIDVAKMARVSKTSVSRYLNSQEQWHMTEETKRRIQEAIDKLDYKPSNIARSLKGKSTNVIGVVINDMTNPFFVQMIRGIEMELKDYDYNILICDSYMSVQKEIESLQMLEQRQIDGILLIGMNMPVAHLERMNVKAPIVLLERDAGDTRFQSVKIDNCRGGYEAVEHLIDQGHRRIAHITGNMQSVIARERQQAYVDCMRSYGIEIREAYQVEGRYDIESGYAGMKRLMELSECPTAVFCANDMMAIGAIRYLLEYGYRIPEDVAVVGYDDIEVASMVTPALTTMRQPVLELAKLATRILLHKMHNAPVDEELAQLSKMKAELVVRKSSVCGDKNREREEEHV